MDKEQALALITNPDAHDHKDTQIVGTLTMMMSKMRRMGRYYGPEHFVLQHGQYSLNEQSDRQLGPKQMCYHNSQMLAIEQIGELLYVEGYVLVRGFPIAHGWNITEDGELIDTTLRVDDCEYFGLVFNTKYVLENMIKESATQALIDDWRNDFPLLKKPDALEEALHPFWNWNWV